MKIGIILHSDTGNTYAVALKLKEKLAKAGHAVEIEQLKPVGKAHPGIKNLQLETYPETSKYEALVFAAPVWAFTISPVLETYLNQLASLKGKKVAGFVTMGFPFAWMGGKSAIQRLTMLCESKEATLIATSILNRMGRYKKQTEEMVERFHKLF